MIGDLKADEVEPDKKFGRRELGKAHLVKRLNFLIGSSRELVNLRTGNGEISKTHRLRGTRRGFLGCLVPRIISEERAFLDKL